MSKALHVSMFGLAVAFLAIVPAVHSQDGKEYTPKNKRFTITIPAGEKSGESAKILKFKTIKVPVESSSSTLKDGTIFAALSIGIPAKSIAGIPKGDRMVAYRNILIDGHKGKVLEEKDIKQGKMSGKEYLVETPKSIMRVQLYMLGGFGFYAVVEGKTKDRVNAKDAEDFFASFKLKDA
jgi:hypothetical protein